MGESKAYECPQCGRFSAEYHFVLNRGLVKALGRLHDFGGSAVIGELGLSNSQYGNFAKLAYWGLMEKRGTKLDRTWYLTQRGKLFIAGRIKVPKGLRVFGRKVVSLDDDMVSARDLDPEFRYRQIEDYIADSSDGGKQMRLL